MGGQEPAQGGNALSAAQHSSAQPANLERAGDVHAQEGPKHANQAHRAERRRRGQIEQLRQVLGPEERLLPEAAGNRGRITSFGKRLQADETSVVLSS